MYLAKDKQGAYSESLSCASVYESFMHTPGDQCIYAGTYWTRFKIVRPKTIAPVRIPDATI